MNQALHLAMNKRVRAIHAAVEYIEVHLIEAITVADVAAAAGYSLYHFIRTFNQVVQHTPYDYLMRRRLSQAALVLLEREQRVIDIAIDFQFKNHETFTRAFGRVFGMTPTHWREEGLEDTRLLMPALERDYLEAISTPTFERPRVVSLDEKMILCGLMIQLRGDADEIPVLWRNLRRIIEGLPEDGDARDFWGVRIHPQLSEGSAYYLAGFRIPALESTPGTFVTKILRAGDYICSSLGDWDPGCVPASKIALGYLYHTYVPKAGLSLCEPLEIEHFGNPNEIFVPVQITGTGK